MGLPTVTDIKQRLSGDTPAMSGAYDAVLADKIDEVYAELCRDVAQARGFRGQYALIADSVATARLFTGKAGGTRYLPIDDAVDVTAVTDGQRTYVEGTDYVLDPLQGTPIVGLILKYAVWSTLPGGITVTAKWGLGADLTDDAFSVICVEVVRSYLADQGGDNDQVGMVTPFGTVQVTKTYTGRRQQLIDSYAFGAAMLR